MDWKELLKPYRMGCPRDNVKGDVNRSDYHRDFNRIIFSLAFRRLVGITQVFPFPNSDSTGTSLILSYTRYGSITELFSEKMSVVYEIIATIDEYNGKFERVSG